MPVPKRNFCSRDPLELLWTINSQNSSQGVYRFRFCILLSWTVLYRFPTLNVLSILLSRDHLDRHPNAFGTESFLHYLLRWSSKHFFNALKNIRHFACLSNFSRYLHQVNTESSASKAAISRMPVRSATASSAALTAITVHFDALKTLPACCLLLIWPSYTILFFCSSVHWSVLSQKSKNVAITVKRLQQRFIVMFQRAGSFMPAYSSLTENSI